MVNYTLKQKLTDNNSGASNNAFGRSLTLSGNILAVGDDVSNSDNHGAVSIYRLEGGLFKFKQKLTDNNSGASTNKFGFAVSLSGDILAVGNIDGTSTNEGVVSIYRLEGGLFKFKQKLSYLARTGANAYGGSIFVSGNILAVGDQQSNDVNHGAVGIYLLEGGLFKFKQILTDNESRGSDNGFGQSVNISGNILAVGDHQSNGDNHGAVSIYYR